MDEQSNPLVECVVHRHFQLHHAAHRDDLGVFQCAGGRGGVGADEAARTQQHPAKVPGHDHDEVGQAAVLQHFQRRGPGGLGRLAVVGVALPVALPQAVGVNVVPRGAVGRAHLLQKGHGLFLAVCKRELRNEAALLLLIFADGCAPDGAVILHADSSCLWCSLQNSIP